MNRNILILFMSWLGVTGYGQATSPNETPITIALHMPDSADGTEAGQYRIGMTE